MLEGVFRCRLVLLQEVGEVNAKLQQLVFRILILKFLKNVARLGVFSLHKWNLSEIESGGKEMRVQLHRGEAERAAFVESLLLDGHGPANIERHWGRRVKR